MLATVSIPFKSGLHVILAVDFKGRPLAVSIPFKSGLHVISENLVVSTKANTSQSPLNRVYM